MRAARWFFRNWYWFNGAIAMAAGIALAVNWATMPTIQWLMLAQLVIINLHFVEEFAIPGGFPLIANTVEKKSDLPDRWPLNQWNAAAGNNWFLVFVYLPAVIWHDATWLTLSITLFGLLEVFAHGVLFTAILKRPYNPGLWTSLLGFLPLAVAYFMHLDSTGTWPAWWVYLVALAYPLAHYLLVFNWLLATVLAKKDTRFPFTRREMERGAYLFDADRSALASTCHQAKSLTDPAREISGLDPQPATAHSRQA